MIIKKKVLYLNCIKQNKKQMKNFTTSLTDNELLKKLKNLKKNNDSFDIETFYPNGDYRNEIYLEKISKHDFQIWVGSQGGFTHDKEGHKKIVQYCNY